MSLVSNLLRHASAGVYWFGRMLAPSPVAWSGATRAMLLTFVGLAVAASLFLVIPYFWIGRLLGFLVLVGFAAAATLVIQIVWWHLAIQPLRFRLASLLMVFMGTFYGLILWGVPGGLIAPIIVMLLVSVTFGSLASLRSGGKRRLRGIPALLGLGAGLVGIAGALWLIMQPAEDVNPWLADYVFEDQTLDLPDPGKPGSMVVTQMTYGSGGDIHRSEYAEGITWKTKSVDGSKLVDRWKGPVGWARTKYWGFDPAALPVQGRVWMPKGAGPFPLVLIVHGNHSMEDFSDPGYAWLGEHFASRGIITVSVDENFLNSSIADFINPRAPGIGRENDARGWMLLKHLQQWRAWNSDRSHALYGKVDMDRIALIGHSRGGEAVAIAAAFNALEHYPDDASKTFDFGFDLKGVIAIAPSDGQYGPRKKAVPLKDISYFSIHGSMDGDVQSFMGSSQMSRVEFTGASDAIKMSLYIQGANHGQFNTVWGLYDTGLPFGWMLNTKGIMGAEDQRRIARVYFTAFLDVVLWGRDDYLPLLGDPRKGAAWLPKHYALANLVPSGRQIIADYEEDLEVSSATFAMAKISAAGLTKWREEWAPLKYAKLDSHVAILAWDNEVEKAASYGFEWTAGSLKLGEESTFAFALADAGEGSKPEGWEVPEGDDASDDTGDEEQTEDKKSKPLDWTLVLTDVYGNQARLALSHDAPLYPQVKSNTRKLDVLASLDKSELVWRRFAFPVQDFMAANPDIQPTALVGLRFEFDKSESGAIAIDDFGIE